MQPTVIPCLNALFAHIDDTAHSRLSAFSEEYLSVNSHLLAEYFTLALNLVQLFDTRPFASQILSSTISTFRYHIKTFEWDVWSSEM
jgi:hypothetical protein